MKNKFFIFVLGIMLVGLMGVASADLGTFKENNCVPIITTLNSTAANLTTVTSPNGTVYFINSPMTLNGYNSFNYSFCNVNETGVYVYGFTDNQGNVYGNSFTITSSGLPVASNNFSIFIWILFILSTMGLFVILIMTLVKLITVKETIFGVIMSWSFIILMIIVNFLASSYLSDNFISGLSSTFITVTIWSNGVLPVISLIITMFIKGTQKKKPLSPQEFTGRFGLPW